MPSQPPRLALVGLMGSGKSRIGRQVSALLTWPFYDADLLTEERTGLSVEAFFQKHGEAAFRDLEADVLVELSRKAPPLVVALGGGVVERPQNRELLKSSFRVVWLQIEPEEAAERLGRGAGRPLLAGRPPLITLRELKARRDVWYREVAHDTFDTHAQNALDLGRAIVARIRSH